MTRMQNLGIFPICLKQVFGSNKTKGPKKMLQQRRYVIREKSQLKFCYEAILYHAQDILAKRKCEY
jgi:hypothetical protein